LARREDWIAAALILGVFAFVGLLAWASKRRQSKPSRGEVRLKRVTEPRVVLKNVERSKIIRDWEGNIVALEVHREVRSG